MMTSTPNRVLQRKWLVETPMGAAKVSKVRVVDDRIYYDLDLVEWQGLEAENNTTTTTGCNRSARHTSSSTTTTKPAAKMTSCIAYPSIRPQVGSEVIITCFRHPGGRHEPQHGRVMSIRPVQRQAVIRLSTWQLAQVDQPSFVTCIMSYDSIQVIASKPVSRMTLYEKVLYVHERRTLAGQLFAQKEWKESIDFYESALVVIRRILYKHKSESVQSIRANIILTKIKCCNQAATACWRIKDYVSATKYTTNALRLLHALEAAKAAAGTKDMLLVVQEEERKKILKTEGEVRVFGCWRVRSLTILAQTLIKLKQWVPAKQVLQQGYKVILKYTQSYEKEKKKSGKDGSSKKTKRRYSKEHKRRIEQLYKANKYLLRLYAKVELKLDQVKNKNEQVVKVGPGFVVAGHTSTNNNSGDNDDETVVSVSSMSVISMVDDDNLMMDDEEYWPPLSSLIPKAAEARNSHELYAASSFDDTTHTAVANNKSSIGEGGDSTHMTDTTSTSEEDNAAGKGPDAAYTSPGGGGKANVSKLANMFENPNSTPLHVSSLSYPGSRLADNLLTNTPAAASTTPVSPLKTKFSQGNHHPAHDKNATKTESTTTTHKMEDLKPPFMEQPKGKEDAPKSIERVNDSVPNDKSVVQQAQESKTNEQTTQ